MSDMNQVLLKDAINIGGTLNSCACARLYPRLATIDGVKLVDDQWLGVYDIHQSFTHYPSPIMIVPVVIVLSVSEKSGLSA